jgi:hypothetical protein
MKLLRITESPLKTKKYRAYFDNGKHTDFGAKGYEDFTIHKNPERARLYRARHKKDLETNDPTRAGFLSYYVLWSAPTFDEGLRIYKNKFHM